MGRRELYVRRIGEQLTLAIEHRAAASRSGIPLALIGRGDALALEIADAHHASPLDPPIPPSRTERVMRALAGASAPVSLAALRQVSRMRTAHLCQTLAELTEQGRVAKTTDGYRLIQE